MFKIEGSTIKVTRGDIGVVPVSAKNGDTDYTFQVGEIVRFKVFKNKDCGCVELQKDVAVETETTEVVIPLVKEDTKIGELISKPVTYWYEVELNPDTDPQTIIGYDDEGAKLFVLYPEGGDKQ
jgi:hypothetical protein